MSRSARDKQRNSSSPALDGSDTEGEVQPSTSTLGSRRHKFGGVPRDIYEEIVVFIEHGISPQFLENCRDPWKLDYSMRDGLAQRNGRYILVPGESESILKELHVKTGHATDLTFLQEQIVKSFTYLATWGSWFKDLECVLRECEQCKKDKAAGNKLRRKSGDCPGVPVNFVVLATPGGTNRFVVITNPEKSAPSTTPKPKEKERPAKPRQNTVNQNKGKQTPQSSGTIPGDVVPSNSSPNLRSGRKAKKRAGEADSDDEADEDRVEIGNKVKKRRITRKSTPAIFTLTTPTVSIQNAEGRGEENNSNNATAEDPKDWGKVGVEESPFEDNSIDHEDDLLLIDEQQRHLREAIRDRKSPLSSDDVQTSQSATEEPGVKKELDLCGEDRGVMDHTSFHPPEPIDHLAEEQIPIHQTNDTTSSPPSPVPVTVPITFSPSEVVPKTETIVTSPSEASLSGPRKPFLPVARPAIKSEVIYLSSDDEQQKPPPVPALSVNSTVLVEDPSGVDDDSQQGNKTNDRVVVPRRSVRTIYGNILCPDGFVPSKPSHKVRRTTSKDSRYGKLLLQMFMVRTKEGQEVEQGRDEHSQDVATYTLEETESLVETEFGMVRVPEGYICTDHFIVENNEDNLLTVEVHLELQKI